ncbi:MAG: LysM peptidoglycan-binding domain-containing protein, partial [Myxococcaceae bacterium]|nr:LysM peptidoglycan-binding domain-containing protein [Myxococcaceae bacterium]
MQTYAIRPGDNLTRIAERFSVSVEDLVRANGITNPDRIYAGDTLTIPDEFSDGERRSSRIESGVHNAHIGDEYNSPNDPNAWRTPTPMGEVNDERRAGVAAGPITAANGRQHPTSFDGTPMYRQGDPEWGARALGTGSSISRAGCAMTATAMAISKISGQPITPGELDQYLDTHRGYSGNALRWDVAASARGLGVERPAWNLDTINRQLDQNRPVVIGIDNRAGSNGGANGTDHWVTVTRRERDAQGNSTYFANDPATGREIRLREQGGRLVGDNNYRSSGQLITFTGGLTRRTGDQTVTPGNTTPLETPQGLRARRNANTTGATPTGGLNLQSELSSPDSTLSIAIGNAEGTRTVNGGRTAAYGSHTDPGNGARNLGTFSYQAHQNPNVRTPEQADQVQLARLRAQIPAYEAAARRAGLDPNNPRLQAAYFDLWNQSPRMAGRFLERLPQTMGG